MGSGTETRKNCSVKPWAANLHREGPLLRHEAFSEARALSVTVPTAAAPDLWRLPATYLQSCPAVITDLCQLKFWEMLYTALPLPSFNPRRSLDKKRKI